MFALHYQFVLPADYDMNIIRDRIRARGHAFAKMNGLVFKQFLLADRGAGAPVNLYAPVYLWASADSALNFLRGGLFAGVCAAFGRPSVDIGLVASFPNASQVESAVSLSKSVEHPGSSLAISGADASLEPGSRQLTWINPGNWSFTAMSMAEDGAHNGQCAMFEVAYLARGREWNAVS